MIVDPPLHQLPVRRRPVRRQLGDRRRPVPSKPRRLRLTGRTVRKPISNARSPSASRGRSADRSVHRQQPVELVYLPVQLLLQADHLARVSAQSARAAAVVPAGHPSRPRPVRHLASSSPSESSCRARSTGARGQRVLLELVP